MTPLQRFLKVNQELRTENAGSCLKSATPAIRPPVAQHFHPPAPLASKRFSPTPRTYKHQDRDVDKQTHLGIDLASIKNAPVPAGNTGRVVFADYLGIYGDVVILDHGLGLSACTPI